MKQLPFPLIVKDMYIFISKCFHCTIVTKKNLYPDNTVLAAAAEGSQFLPDIFSDYWMALPKHFPTFTLFENI